MLFAAARCLLFVLRCAARPRCARPGVLSFSSADSLFVPGLWPLRGRGRVLSAFRGLRCRCAPPPVPVSLRGAGSCVTCCSVRWASCFSQGFALGLVVPPWRVVSSLVAPAAGGQVPGLFRVLVHEVLSGVSGCATSLCTCGAVLRRRPTFSSRHRSVSPGAAPLACRLVFRCGSRCVSRGFARGWWFFRGVLVPASCAPAAGGDRRGFLCG